MSELDPSQGLFEFGEAEVERLLPELKFVGWDAPLLDSVCAWLLERRESLANTLVVVPTTNSGRRLRMALSEGGGVFAPHVMAPSGLFQVETVASRQEALWAWIAAIRELDVEDYPNLFPNYKPGSTRSFSSALALARQMLTLRDMLADGDADFRDAVFHSPEEDRWKELVKIETQMLNHLGSWKISDPVLAKRKRAKAPVLPVGVDRIVVACVPDPTLLASRALESFLNSGISVTVLVHAPESEMPSFDPWGIPLSDVWKAKTIDIPDWKNRLHVVDSATEATEACIQIFAEEKTTSENAALALCDATFSTVLEKGFAESGWQLFDPEGRSLLDSGLIRLLRALKDLTSREGIFTALQETVRQPGAELFLPPDVTRKEASSLMDQLHDEHLPETFVDAAFLASPRQKVVIEAMTQKLSDLKKGNLSATLRSWLAFWLEGADRDLVKAAEPALADALDALERLESCGSYPTAGEAFEMLAESLKSARVVQDRAKTVLDLQGWLEISYDAAPHLILAGMHEECVPDGTADDLFVPDSLRKKLGLRDAQGRFARDAFLLQAAIRSRSDRGRVDAIVARFNDAGESRKPSRLLMRQQGKELADLVEYLFAESESNKPTGGAWQRDWKLALPSVENPYIGSEGNAPRKLSPSAIKDYMHCPLRFYLKRIVRMEAYERGKTEMNPMDFGNLCHYVVEKFGKDPSTRDSEDEAEIAKYLSGLLDERVRQLYGKKLSLPLMVQLDSARERLHAFAQKQAEERKSGWRIVETEFQVGGRGEDEGIVWKINDHPITMIVDRIDRHEDGKRWRVWDYKTSGKAKSPEGQHLAAWKEEENRPKLGDLVEPQGKSKTQKRWADVQLPLYAAFVQEHFKTRDVPEVGYINLPRAVSEVAFLPWKDFDQVTLDHALSWAGEAIDQIRAGHFNPPAELPVKEREWDDFAELAPDGLAAAFDLSS